MYLTHNSVKRLDDYLKNFKWPISETLEAEIAIELLKNFISLLNDTSGYDAIILRGMAGLFIPKVTGLLYSMVIYQIAKEDKYLYSPSYTSDHYHWQHIGGDKQYVLDSQIPKYSTKNYKRLIKSSIDLVARRDYSNVILQPNPSLWYHIRSNDISPSRVYIEEFYSPLMKFFSKKRFKIGGLHHKLVEMILSSVVDRSLRSYISEQSIAHLVSYLEMIVMRYFDLASKSTISKKIKMMYAGNQGNLATRIASLAVLSHGGEVCSYSHTSGFLVTLPHFFLAENVTSSASYFYTELHKKLSNKSIQRYGAERICCFDGHKVLKCDNVMSFKQKKYNKIKNVTYVMTTLCFDDDVHYDVLTPIVRRLYMEIQIIDLLLEIGLTVTLKIHRKDIGSRVLEHHLSMLNQRYLGRMKFSYEDFDLYLKSRSNDIDLLIVENFSSGATIQSIRSDKRCMIFTILDPDPKLLELGLAKRMKIIKVTSDCKNRPIFNKDDVLKYLKKDQHAVDFSILKHCVNFGCDY